MRTDSNIKKKPNRYRYKTNHENQNYLFVSGCDSFGGERFRLSLGMSLAKRSNAMIQGDTYMHQQSMSHADFPLSLIGLRGSILALGGA